jgi:hypothetical protein
VLLSFKKVTKKTKMEFEFCLEHKNKRLNLICTQCDRGDVPMCDGCLEKNQKHYAHFNEPRPELELNRLPGN